jgi:hypothetical protein
MGLTMRYVVNARTDRLGDSEKERKRPERYLKSLKRFILFLFFLAGSGAYPPAPDRGGVGEKESHHVSPIHPPNIKYTPIPGNGTQNLKYGNPDIKGINRLIPGNGAPNTGLIQYELSIRG